MYQEVDLEHYLNDKPTTEQKIKFAELAVDEIRSRTLQNEDINGKKFTKYTKDYAKEKGVSRSDVNLFVEGKLLDGVGRRKSKEKSNTVFIQMKKGKETLKAHGHNKGYSKGKLPQREFFGITDDEAKKIAQKVKESTPKRTLADLKLQLGEQDESEG
jgi:phage gpG-like protein